MVVNATPYPEVFSNTYLASLAGLIVFTWRGFMLAFIKKHYLEERRLSSNLFYVIYPLLFSWSAHKVGVYSKAVPYWVIISFCIFLWIRVLMALYCILKFWGQK